MLIVMMMLIVILEGLMSLYSYTTCPTNKTDTLTIFFK